MSDRCTVLNLRGPPSTSMYRRYTSARMDGHTSTRFTARGVTLHPGDRLQLFGIPDLSTPAPDAEHPATPVNPSQPKKEERELAPVDYIEIGPNGYITPQ